MTTDDFALPAHEFQAISALHWISRFGWLRARELGALMWPPRDTRPGSLVADDHRMNEQRKLASRLLSRLKESRYVLQRRLPGKAGDAYVLSGAGVHYLQRRLAYTARAGDKWGRFIDGKWLPPSSWEHELIVTLTMLHFLSRGATIKTELEIRAENPGQRKYPDGLVVSKVRMRDGSHQDMIQWVEVESADKSGLKMLALARSLIDVTRRQAPTLSSLVANVPTIVYRSDLVNLAGRKVDHKNRITKAVQRHIGADLSLFFVQMSFKNTSYHVAAIEVERTRIHRLDPGDPTSDVKSAFAVNREGIFTRTVVDEKGRDWTLKVRPLHDRYRYEIWTAPKPEEGKPTERFGYPIETLEDAFRTVLARWTARFYQNSYESQ